MRRTTVELDEELLERARRALSQPSARATIEEALRRAADAAGDAQQQAVVRERRYFERLAKHIDRSILLSEEMWR